LKVITISGKARHGKTTSAEIIAEKLEKKGNRVLITHYGDLLKYICEKFFGWNGIKDEIGRTRLQYVGTDVIREQRPNYWVDFTVGILQMFLNEWDYVLVPDCRFPNEIETLKEQNFDILSFKVIRPNFDNGLTEEQKKHPSETALDNYEDFDYIVKAENLEQLENRLVKAIDILRL